MYTLCHNTQASSLHVLDSIWFQATHTVDGRNPAPPGMVKKTVWMMGINYQPQLVSRISSINSIICLLLNKTGGTSPTAHSLIQHGGVFVKHGKASRPPEPNLFKAQLITVNIQKLTATNLVGIHHAFRSLLTANPPRFLNACRNNVWG